MSDEARTIGIGRLVEGLEPPLLGGVRSLLWAYCGTSRVPAPFAGRGPVLAALRDALLDPSGHPLMVLDAPTGRGKTALLCHLALTLSAQATVVFHPFSERFLTADGAQALDGLNARLTRLHESRSPPARARPNSGPSSPSTCAGHSPMADGWW